MEAKMSLGTRKELLKHVQERYRRSNRAEKTKILDELIATTGYGRKYAIGLFRHLQRSAINKDEKRHKKRKYDEAVYQALNTIWQAANQICSKRLIPFLPDLLAALERHGHVSLPNDVRTRLLSLSPATADRLLKKERTLQKKGISTTRAGNLLKNQIKIRTFNDWNDVVPGFLEGDLVAHCGGCVEGSYLNTLVLTDIASTWTEFFPFLFKGEAGVIASLKILQQILPFSFLGLDTDNGSEFINYTMLNFCKENKITFTRSRPYRKNDQAHFEEKNGSIVRRLLGYDRYESVEAYQVLLEFYGVLRLYVNFFQPSLKLLSKERNGSKVTKRYDKAKTPCQRLLACKNISEEIKEKLKRDYDTLDPFKLMKELQRLQEAFWKQAWKQNDNSIAPSPTEVIKQVSNNEADGISSPSPNIVEPTTAISSEPDEAIVNIQRYYHRTRKPRKPLAPRVWRTREDVFSPIWDEIKLKLELFPQRTVRNLLDELIKDKPNEFNPNMLRTLQRRVAEWRAEQMKEEKTYQHRRTSTIGGEVERFVSLAYSGE